MLQIFYLGEFFFPLKCSQVGQPSKGKDNIGIESNPNRFNELRAVPGRVNYPAPSCLMPAYTQQRHARESVCKSTHT